MDGRLHACMTYYSDMLCASKRETAFRRVYGRNFLPTCASPAQPRTRACMRTGIAWRAGLNVPTKELYTVILGSVVGMLLCQRDQQLLALRGWRQRCTLPCAFAQGCLVGRNDLPTHTQIPHPSRAYACAGVVWPPPLLLAERCRCARLRC